ncbi:MAG: hypothetical protein ACPGXZ_14055 [Saprospiraceae bacterium]
MKGRNLLLKGMRGAAGGFVATTAADGDVVLREMPKRGNQGKDAAHIPAQSRARVCGQITRKAKTALRGTFTDRRIGLSAVNEFQKYNMNKANGVISPDGVIDFEKLRVADGNIPLSGLTISNEAYNDGVADTIDADISFNTNANGTNVQLRAFVMSSESYEAKVVTLPITQDGTGGTVSVNVDGYSAPVVYVFWYDTVEKSASSSVYVLLEN